MPVTSSIGPFAAPLLALTLLAAVAVAQPEPASPAAPPAPEAVSIHARFDRLLARHVRNERVDYLTLRDEDRPELAAYLEDLAAVDPAELSGPARCALFVNLYNATVIATVCDRYVDGWTVAGRDSSFAVFREPLVRLGGERITLDALEKQRALVEFRDPRLHAAFVCAARSCPPLRGAAFTPERLEAELDARMRAFVNDPTRNRLDAGAPQVSKLFEWYAEDFGGGPDGVRRFLTRWSDRPLRPGAIRYLDYSWQLNIAAPPGDWVTITATVRSESGSPVLAPGSVVKVETVAGDTLTVRRPGGAGSVAVARGATRPWRAPR